MSYKSCITYFPNENQNVLVTIIENNNVRNAILLKIKSTKPTKRPSLTIEI